MSFMAWPEENAKAFPSTFSPFSFVRLVWPAQIIYVTSLLSFGKALLQRDKQDLCRSILPVMAVISPPQNMILLAVHLCLEKVVSRQKVINDQLMLYGFMGWTLFFHMVSVVFPCDSQCASI